MKTLVIGLLLLSGWSALSTYIYVCKIKGLCNEPASFEISAVNAKEIISMDSLTSSAELKVSEIPNDLTVYFAFDKSEFNSDSVSEKFFMESNDFLNKNATARINITGHTDAIGSEDYNQALGFRRAESLLNYFESKGLSASRIIIGSQGEKQPADDNNTDSGRAKNRRTSITIKN